MKKLILSAAAFTMLCLGHMTAQTATAQAGTATSQKSSGTPEQESAKHASKMATELGLTEDQKSKVQALDLERLKANQPLREQGKAATTEADKKSIRQQMKANNEKFETSVIALLTPDQKAKWEEQKKAMKEKRMEKRKPATSDAPSGQ